MQYETEERPGIIEVKLRGQVTYADHPSFRSIMSRLAESAAQTLVFELNNVEFIDSAGLGMLLIVRDTAEQKKADVILRHPRGQVQKIFTSSKFETLFTIEA